MSKELEQNNRNSFSIFVHFVWVVSIAFVAYFSLSPDVELPFEFKQSDKLYHFLAYLWLAGIPFLGFQSLKVAVAGALLMLPFGFMLECAQGLTVERFFSIGDMIANGIGVLLGVSLGRYLKLRFFASFRP